jgi:cyanate permease
MDEDIKAGLATIGLGALIVLGMLAFAVQGQPYIWLAVLVFGFVAAGLIGMGLYSIMRRARESDAQANQLPSSINSQT